MSFRSQIKSSQVIQIRTSVSKYNEPNVSPTTQNEAIIFCKHRLEGNRVKTIISPPKHIVNKFDPTVHAEETKQSNHIL